MAGRCIRNAFNQLGSIPGPPTTLSGCSLDRQASGLGPESRGCERRHPDHFPRILLIE